MWSLAAVERKTRRTLRRGKPGPKAAEPTKDKFGVPGIAAAEPDTGSAGEVVGQGLTGLAWGLSRSVGVGQMTLASCGILLPGLR